MIPQALLPPMDAGHGTSWGSGPESQKPQGLAIYPQVNLAAMGLRAFLAAGRGLTAPRAPAQHRS